MNFYRKEFFQKTGIFSAKILLKLIFSVSLFQIFPLLKIDLIQKKLMGAGEEQ